MDEFNRISNRGCFGMHGARIRVALYSAARSCLQELRASADALVGATVSAILRDISLQLAKTPKTQAIDIVANAPASKKRSRNQDRPASAESAPQPSPKSFLDCSPVIIISALEGTEQPVPELMRVDSEPSLQHSKQFSSALEPPCCLRLDSS